MQEVPNFAKDIEDWTEAEWRGAVTAMSMYRHYLEREIIQVTAFLDMSAGAGNFQNEANNAGVISSEQCLTIDPAWAAKLIRRLQREAKVRSAQ